MALVVGIDEAGYGPLLGPMVVASCQFECGAADIDLWELLAERVARHTRGSGDRLTVADSKELFSGRKPLSRLERNLMPFLMLGPAAQGFEGFLARLGCAQERMLSSYPWYRARQMSLPVEAPDDGLTEKAARLRDVLNRQGVTWGGFRAEVVTAGELNREVTQSDSKAAVLLRRIGLLLHYLWSDNKTRQECNVICDRIGGRKRYGDILTWLFPMVRIRRVAEDARASRYVLWLGEREHTVSFVCKADRDYLPVALASMCAKYVRELFMRLFNGYWTARKPGLRPTAGYVTDARRFLSEIDDVRIRDRIPAEILVRAR